MVAPLLLGLAGPRLTATERAFIGTHHPAAFLLFARNIESPSQVRDLCAELASLSPFAPLIAVDQEGGRVQRLHFGGRLPAAGVFGEWAKHDLAAARRGAYLQGLLLAAELREAGATWALAPCVDLQWPQTHGIIGDRAFSGDPWLVTQLAAAQREGLRAGGVFDCLKHAPGHGQAVADSHHELPVVQGDLDKDMVPYAALAPGADFIMTAHISYPEWDARTPATFSHKILSGMRQKWGFDGLILADDLGMKALDGSYASRMERALGAGCDLVICSFSKLVHGMAGTVFDQEHFDQMAGMTMPTLNQQAADRLGKLTLPAKADADSVAAARAELRTLWADGPARMGYDLAL